MIKITARRLGNFVPHFVVELEGDEKTLTNILEKLKLYRTLDKDLKEINPQDIKPALDVLGGKMSSTEFRSLEDMTPPELALERKQTWVITKSSHAWWIHRNNTPFMPVQSEEKAVALLEKYGIKTYAIDRSQKASSSQDFADMRRDKLRVMSGRGPSVARRVWRWFGGDAA